MMQKIKRGAAYTIVILILAISHYWVTLAIGFLLQALAVIYAAAERGYYAMGSEMLVLPVVFAIGYYFTPVMEVCITEKGVRYRVRGKRVSGDTRTAGSRRVRTDRR